MQSPQYAIFTQKLSPAHRLALVVGILCLILQISGLPELLRFSRDEIMAGQWWRLLTGNLVHLGYSHLLLNLAGLAVISALLGQSMGVRAWAVTGLISMAGVGLGLLLFDPQLKWYVGLSGVLYGLLLGGAIAEFRQQKLIALVVGLYTIGKIVWEQLHGAVESSEKLAGGTVIVNAHMYGMIAGAITVLALLGIGTLTQRAT